MFNVVSEGRDLRVTFSYPNKGQTYCAVLDRGIESLDGDTNATIHYGFAQCNPKEQFEKNKGRKYALRDALNSMPRENRDVFWQAYFEVRHGQF